MENKNYRATVLMGILLGVMVLYFFAPNILEPKIPVAAHYHNGVPVPPPIPGENSISNLQIIKEPDDSYSVVFDYFYTGEPFLARLGVAVILNESDAKVPYMGIDVAERGHHTKTLKLHNPLHGGGNLKITKYVKAGLIVNSEYLVSATKPLVIEWKTPYEEMMARRYATASVDELYNEAVELIDMGDSASLSSASEKLEKLIEKDAKFSSAYLEFARIAMKSNWGKEGLSQAENHIYSALKLDDKNPNSYVLLGYVYVHQNKYDLAIVQFKKAKEIGTENLWLWANWGQLFLKQGKYDLALEYYLKAVEKDRPYNTYDRARLDAYKNIIYIYKKKENISALDSIYKKRADEFKSSGCYLIDYAKFKVLHLGDYESGMLLAQQGLDNGCRQDDAKKALGLAHYFKWADAAVNEGDQLLAKAQVFYPSGPNLFYDVVNAKDHEKVVSKLLASNFDINVKDNAGRTALALALFNKDKVATSKLIKVGADVNVKIGDESYPISFIPITLNDIDLLTLLKDKGVDYSKVTYQGINGVEFAKMYGSPDVVNFLVGKKI